jgi:Arc/MetJ-type ribon-helix-helix transcriptional regulator
VTKSISVRLDDAALKALRQLEAAGLSRSDAIRHALVNAASRMRSHRALRAEARALETDMQDRREMLEVAALMEQLRAPR